MTTLTPEVFRSALEGRMPSDEQSINAILAHGTAINSLEVYTAQVELCQSREDSLKDSMKKLPSEINLAFGIELLKAKIDQSKVEKTELQKIADEREIKSSVHGRVGSLTIKYGARVQKDERVGEIIDEQCRFMLTPVPSSEVPYLREGEIVGLVFPGNKKSQGVVRKIPMRVMSLAEGQEYVNETDPLVEVRIDPTNDSIWPSVPIGSAVKVEMSGKK
jgi:multidrug resistance efflux pump